MKKTIFTLIVCLSAVLTTGCAKKGANPAPDPKINLDTPTGLTVTNNTNNSATLEWKPVENALCYNIYLDKNDSLAYAVSVKPEATITGLKPGTQYQARVKATAASQSKWNDSDLSSPVSFKTLENPELAKPVIEAIGIGVDSISFKWSSIAEAENYKYTFTGPSKEISQTTQDSLVCFNGLAEGVEYTLKVQAIPSAEKAASWNPSQWGELKVSTKKIVSLGKVTPTCIASRDSLSIAWTEVEFAGAYEYTVNGGETLTTSKNLLILCGLEPNTEYTIRLRAIPDPAHSKEYTPGEWASITVTTENFEEYTTEHLERGEGKW